MSVLYQQISRYNNFPVFGKTSSPEPMYTDILNRVWREVSVIKDHVVEIEQELATEVVYDVFMESTYDDIACVGLSVVNLFDVATYPDNGVIQLNMRPLYSSDETIAFEYDSICKVVDVRVGTMPPIWAAFVFGGLYGNDGTNNLTNGVAQAFDGTILGPGAQFYGAGTPNFNDCFDVTGPFGDIRAKGPGSFSVIMEMDIQVSAVVGGPYVEFSFQMVSSISGVIAHTIVQTTFVDGIMNNLASGSFVVTAQDDTEIFTMQLTPDKDCTISIVNYRSQVRNIDIQPSI